METEETNIHEIIRSKCELAQIYAEDGAFHTASQILEKLSKDIEIHAIACDSWLNQVFDEG